MSINYTPENTFIFSFVRMNPPTPGHLDLIKSMIDKAISLGVNKVYVITSSSLDGKNPLPCSPDSVPKPKNKTDAKIISEILDSNSIFKSSVLNEMISSYKKQLIEMEPSEEKKLLINNFQVIVLCSVGSPFAFIFNIIKNDFIDKSIPKINMIFIVGRDRADFLDTIIDNYRTKDFIESVDGLILERHGMESLKNIGIGDRDISAISNSEYSASFIRGLVKNGRREDFEKVYNKYINPEDIQKLYETINIGIQMKSPSSKEEDENPQSKYFDGGLLPIINTSGGKRRKSRKIRKLRKIRKTIKRNTKYKRYNKKINIKVH